MRYKALFIDLSGVLYIGDKVVPGAVQFIDSARKAGLALRFVTNTARKTREQVLQDLAALGFTVQPEELFTAPLAARDYARQQGLRPFCLVHQSIREEFSELEQSRPNAVIIGDAADDLNYPMLNRAFRLCLQGAVLIGIGYNRYFKLENEFYLDAGPFIKAIEFASDSQAIIIGKPSVDFFRQLLSTVEARAEEVLMIGDDVYGDVEGAINAGLHGCLVRTGKYQFGDEDKIAATHFCVDSIVDVQTLLD